MYKNLADTFSQYKDFLEACAKECPIEDYVFLDLLTKRNKSIYYVIPTDDFDQPWMLYDHLANVLRLWDKHTDFGPPVLVDYIEKTENVWYCKLDDVYIPFFTWAMDDFI